MSGGYLKKEQMSDLLEKYQKEIIPLLQKEMKIDNSLAVPRLVKVVVGQGLKEAAHDEGVLKKALVDLGLITGQKPSVRKAKKSISVFKLVKGDPVGLMVTLRGKRMYDFLAKILHIVLPRVRDFRGVSPSGFDGRGNYTLGIEEQIVFPEIEFVKTEKTKGLQVTIVTNAQADDKARHLLELMGMPFRQK